MRVGTVPAVRTCRGTTADGAKAGDGWGVQKRRSSVFKRTHGVRQEDPGSRGNGDKRSSPGPEGRGLHSPDEGSRVVHGGLHWRGSFSRPQAWPLKNTALSAPPCADLTRPGPDLGDNQRFCDQQTVLAPTPGSRGHAPSWANGTEGSGTPDLVVLVTIVSLFVFLFWRQG